MHALAMSKNIALRGALIFLLLSIAEIFAADRAQVTSSLAPDAGRLVVDVHGVPPPAPVFFSATVEQTVRISAAESKGELRVKLKVVQGKPDTLTLGLTGEGEVTGVVGAGLRDWSVRQGTVGKRFLDLRLEAGAPRDVEVIVQTRLVPQAVPGTMAVLLATPGDAVGFVSHVTLQPDSGIDLRVTTATGLTPLGDVLRFVASGEARLEVRLLARGGGVPEAELVGARLNGRVNEAGGSVEFQLRGELRAWKAGARLRLLAGRAAVSERTAGDGWRVELATLEAGDFAYELVAERAGNFPVELKFAAAVSESGDWRALDFKMPAGAVVPLALEGLGPDVSFKSDAAVVPTSLPPSGGGALADGWRGFLPADGAAELAWRRTRAATEGALAFTSTELTEVRVGAGLLRQTSQLSFRILQGKLAAVRCRVEGAGEIVGVEGANVVGWTLLPAEGGRVLDVRLSRPMEAQAALTVQAQAELGSWPVRAEPLRLTPVGGVRHSGFVRVANRGAVRLEVADVAGMMQLAPAQFPGAALEAGARQVFVYRFPSASYGYRVLAAQIQPEIGVSAIATYELAETARVIAAAIELDLREAPLRDWTLRIPADYTVVAVTGSDVADHVAETEATEGMRALRILFGRAIEGRQLLHVRLEKNQPAAAGEWTLPPLRFPGAKSVRGHVGASAAPGYRLAPVRVDRLVEVPLSFFPQPVARLQQAWRLREADWVAELRAEALGQAVQADVFHLYALKEGVVTSSVLLNYFVVGAPASEWRIEVPTTVGNLDITGQNVRRDWRREGDQVIVSLHQPVLGAATLLLTFEQPMSARGGVITPGVVRPLGVESERGFLQVVSPLQVKHEIRRAEGALLKLEPTELPAEFRTFTSAPSLAVYQYTARRFAFEMGIEWHAPGETIDQVVDFAKLVSQVSRDGQIVTEATYYVKTRGRKALRLVLPAGVTLWEARVDREIVHARVDGEQTLIPLPPRPNPNEPAMVSLRIGQPATGGKALRLAAPRAASAPTIINEWIVRADTGRLLVPHSGNAELTRPALTETGFEWLSTRGGLGAFVTLSLVGLGVLLRRARSGWGPLFGLLAIVLSVGGAAIMAHAALFNRRLNVPELNFATTIVPAGESVALDVANVVEWQAWFVGWGVAAVIAGVLALAVGGWFRRHAFLLAGVLLVAIGLLAQRGGAAAFFTAGAAAIFFGMLVPGVIAWRRERRELIDDAGRGAEPGSGAATIASLALFVGLASFAVTEGPSLQAAESRRVEPSNKVLQALPATKAMPRVPSVEASVAIDSPVPQADGSRPAQVMIQTWSIRGERLFGEIALTVKGAPGESVLLLRAPAVVIEFSGEGLRLGKVERDGQAAYYVATEREGTFTARVRFELPVPDRTQPIALPTGPAVTQRLTIELDQAGWEFVSPMAMLVLRTDYGSAEPGAAGKSGATLVLAPHTAAYVQLRPRQRDLATEATQFFAETANLYVPGPGVVNGFARVTVRPVQGRVSALELEIPAGLTVGEVARGPVGAWRFDPQTRRLHVAIEPAQSALFHFDVETQLGAGELPFAVALEPLRVRGAAGDAGLLALAFGGDAQPEGVRASELSAVNIQDFEAALLPRTREGQPLAAVQHVWRYGPTGGRVELKIAPVSPEVRVATKQVLSLDDDRMLMAVDLRVAITRVGLFKLSFALPAGLEIESISGAALSQWTEAQEVPATGSEQAAQRIVTLHLNGRTLGEQAFNLTLAGAAPGAQANWAFPRLRVREATRQTGEALVVPGKGIRVRAVEREKVTQLDPRTVGGMQPGTLAFRLLQDDWVLRLGVELLEPWVTVQALQEVTLREGQTLTRLAVRYRVENAAIKSARVRLPGLDAERTRTVRASGPAVSEIVAVAGETDLWEIRFQRGIAGESDVQIEFSGAANARGAAAAERASTVPVQESIVTPEFVGARQTVQFVAVRSGGRLEIEAPVLPRGWTRTDWSAVPVVLQQRSDRSVPALNFRVAEPEGALAVVVRRHAVAEALKLRVTRADLLTLFAPRGAALTAMDLNVDVLEKSTLRVRLPAGARLFNTLVNGESVAVVREGDAWLFYVTPNQAGERAAVVRLVYAAADDAKSAVLLAGPSLSVPLENVTWRVVIPPGYKLDDYRGALRLQDQRTGDAFGVDQYVSLVSSKRSAEAKEAMSQLQLASSWLQKGEQDKAASALLNASNRYALDEATNEDARVQLRNLKTQQAVLGLNTRRQRLYLDNLGDTTRNAQLEQAVTLNPFMQGKVNFNPQQADQLLAGNTAEENTALRGIAARIVDQQLAADPAPGAIDVTLPERGRVLTFTRSVQVDGSAPLELMLEVEKITRVNRGLIAILLLGVAMVVGTELSRRKAAHAI